MKKLISIIVLLFTLQLGFSQSDYSVWTDSMIIKAFSGTAALTLDGGDFTLTKYKTGDSNQVILVLNKLTGTIDTVSSISGGSNITNTSQLINDGEDSSLVNPYISYNDLYLNNAVINGNYYHIDSFTHYFWADKYIINNVTYSAYISDTLTLEDSHPTLDRIDLAVINSDQTISIIKGTPDTNPSKPDIDDELQVEFTFFIVEAGTTSPNDIVNRVVYNENSQEPTEWNTTTSNASVNLSAIDDSQLGDTSIKFTSASINDKVLFNKSTNLDGDNLSNIIIRVKLITVPSNQRFNVRFVNTAGANGFTVTVRDGVFNFNSSLLNIWQEIIIPQTVLGLNNKSYDRVVIWNKRNNATFFLDNIIIQEGTNNINEPIGSTSIVNATDNDKSLNNGDSINVRYLPQFACDTSSANEYNLTTNASLTDTLFVPAFGQVGLQGNLYTTNNDSIFALDGSYWSKEVDANNDGDSTQLMGSYLKLNLLNCGVLDSVVVEMNDLTVSNGDSIAFIAFISDSLIINPTNDNPFNDVFGTNANFRITYLGTASVFNFKTFTPLPLPTYLPTLDDSISFIFGVADLYAFDIDQVKITSYYTVGNRKLGILANGEIVVDTTTTAGSVSGTSYWELQPIFIDSILTNTKTTKPILMSVKDLSGFGEKEDLFMLGGSLTGATNESVDFMFTDSTFSRYTLGIYKYSLPSQERNAIFLVKDTAYNDIPASIGYRLETAANEFGLGVNGNSGQDLIVGNYYTMKANMGYSEYTFLDNNFPAAPDNEEYLRVSRELNSINSDTFLVKQPIIAGGGHNIIFARGKLIDIGYDTSQTTVIGSLYNRFNNADLMNGNIDVFGNDIPFVGVLKDAYGGTVELGIQDLGAFALDSAKIVVGWTDYASSTHGLEVEKSINKILLNSKGNLELSSDGIINIITDTTVIEGQLQYIDGNEADGKYLGSDSSGVASWQTLPSTPSKARLGITLDVSDDMDTVSYLGGVISMPTSTPDTGISIFTRTDTSIVSSESTVALVNWVITYMTVDSNVTIAAQLTNCNPTCGGYGGGDRVRQYTDKSGELYSISGTSLETINTSPFGLWIEIDSGGSGGDIYVVEAQMNFVQID